MKKLIMIALILSIITGFAVYYYATNLEKNLQVKTVPVAVAVKAIPKNTEITAEMIEIKQYPEETVSAMSAKSMEDIKGRVTKQDIEASEQIITAKLSTPNKKNEGLSYTIKEGYRALTIKTDEITGIAGHISAGDHVDIIATLMDKNTASGTVTKMIAENIEVLEVGIKQVTTEEKTSTAYSSITVSVLAEDVLKINYALSEGKFSLTLRSVLDKNVVSPAGYTPW